MKECECYRCGKTMEPNPEVFNNYNLSISTYQEKFKLLVCDNCLDWYRSGGVNNGRVEFGILHNKYDKNGVNLLDKFREEKKENEQKKG